MTGPRILLVVGGGIAAYKSCELVRQIRKEGGDVTCVLTEGGAQFVTPMALAALSGNQVHTSLFDLKNEVEMGHIQLSREADLIVVCPATANMMAKMAAGIADDLATTLLLATDKPVMAVPAMNVRMWQHAATVRNVQVLREAGVDVMEPEEGTMACGEYGPGRLPDPMAIWQRIAWALGMGPVEIAPLPGASGYDMPYPALPGHAPDDDAYWTAGLGDPEGEGEEVDVAGLGGLSGSLVSRSVAKAREQAAALEAGGEALSVPAPEPGGPSTPPGSLFARKGDARAAPPTDPEAINHLTSRHGDAVRPEAFQGEVEGAFPSVGGQQPGLYADGPFGDAHLIPVVEDQGPWDGPLSGRHVLVTAGPTWEPIDPVRYIANRSSGKQGFAIAAAAARAGARVTLVTGPVHLPTPPCVDRIDVETAEQMADAVKRALPADVGVMVAAVADWRPANTATEKLKKRGSAPPALMLTENPDILATLGSRPDRPPLLIGFAAETNDVVRYAREKRKRKGADWIIANDVSGDVMGGDNNAVHIVRGNDVISLPEMPKEEVARLLVERFADAFSTD